MKKRSIFLFLIIIMVLIISGCNKKSSLDFKKEYENVNGKIIRDDIKYRSLDISEDNPYIKTTIKDIENKINNKESFYLYVGDSLCPWCRSGLEKMIEVANKVNVKKIYYIDFWDDEHNEILRDLYEVENNNGEISFKKTKDSVEGYDTLLNAVSEFVQDYTIIKDGTEYNVGVKRIYGGDHFYFKDGICKNYVSLRSDKLLNANDELTEEVLKDQEDKFIKFFTSNNTCDGEENC